MKYNEDKKRYDNSKEEQSKWEKTAVDEPSEEKIESELNKSHPNQKGKNTTQCGCGENCKCEKCMSNNCCCK